MLRSKGHDVDLFEADNDHIDSGFAAFRAAIQCMYSPASARTVRQRMEGFRPDVVHIHNFFPTLSPSIHYAASSAGVPVVQTLHNYRLLCPASTLLRDGKPCEDCACRRLPWPAVHHKCYRGSTSASAAVAAMLAFHRQIGTWHRTVSRFITLTEFARNKFAESGIPRHKIAVKPNFLAHDPGIGSGGGGYALFVGRLTPEKGIGTLLEAWKLMPPGMKLRIVGDGPLRGHLSELTRTNPDIEWMQRQTRETIYRLMKEAAILVIPSIWYEGFPMVVAEALATALPVLASRIGALAEVIEDGITGQLFAPGNPEHLAQMARNLLESPDNLRDMRRNARREFEDKYTACQNYDSLLSVYREAISENSQ
jgi:glycosyltransferase involved in cell wall biosynthesis